MASGDGSPDPRRNARRAEMLARIGVMTALNRNVVRVFNTDRKDRHWGKRKLKRDEWPSRHERPERG